MLTGPATAIPGFAAALASELGMPVDAGVVDGAPAGIDAGRVTVAAGLAARGGPGMRAVNLIPVDEPRGLRGARRRSGGRLLHPARRARRRGRS